MRVEVIAALESDAIKIRRLRFQFVHQASCHSFASGFLTHTKVRDRCLSSDDSVKEIPQKASCVTYCDEQLSVNYSFGKSTFRHKPQSAAITSIQREHLVALC
jgi:hypothetical protein